MIYLADSVQAAQKTVHVASTYIQPGDRLGITVTALDPLAAAPFNLSAASQGGSSTQTVEQVSYLVDSTGNIRFPQLGKVYVSGFTVNQVAATLQEKLVPYIKEPLATVNIVNFKVNVLGEVNSPGTITITDGKATILEALSLSGDLTIFGKRDNILVVREINGTREFGRLNLASNDIFTSPFFYLKQNDVIYVEMDKTKIISNDVIANRNIRNYTIALSTLTTLLVIIYTTLIK